MAVTPPTTRSLRIISPGGQGTNKSSRSPPGGTRTINRTRRKVAETPATFKQPLMRTPPNADIAAPEFPEGTEWLNVAFLRMDQQIGRHAVLLEFWDHARINSLRTLPYTKAWHERYAGQGLRVIGVHSPGYSFGRDRAGVERAVERLGIEYP